MNTTNSEQSVDELMQLLRDNQTDLTVVEGLRLMVAFKKVEDPSDRLILIELAERLTK